MTPKPPPTPVEALRKAAGRARLDVDGARDLLDSVEDTKSTAEAVAELDLNLAVPELVDALAPLVEAGLVDAATVEALSAAHDVIEGVAGTAIEQAQALVEAYDEAEEKVSECETHRDSERGEYDADTKADAREEAKDALSELADALDAYETPAAPAAPTEETP